MTALPFGLSLYRVAMAALAGFVPGYLMKRAKAGKEDVKRLDERLGIAGAPRPEGALIWLHAASVGESLMALNVARGLLAARGDLSVLLTSGTVTSANVIAKQTDGRLLHQYVPVDTEKAVAGFLDHWRPDVGAFFESELWPNLILAAQARGIGLALLNGRMNGASIRNWSRFRGSARHLLGAFEVLQAADGLTASALADLSGRDVAETGNLKLAAPPLPIDTAALEKLAKTIGKRPIWLAASTHDGEEALVLDAHASLILGDRTALLILAPRHPDRALAVQLLIERSGLVSARRSTGSAPTPATQVWHWDTLGELGLAYKLASVTLVAGSLVPGIGGHNPVEPVQLGSAVITGPFTASFDDLMAAFEAGGGARVLAMPSANALAMAVAGLWGDPEIRAKQCAAASHIVASGKGSLALAVDGVLSLLKAKP